VVVNATSFIIDNWGRYPDATSSGRVMTNRIADGAAVSLVSGASLSLWGGPRTLASSNEIAEHIGSLIFDKGANSVAVRYAYAEGTAGQTSGPVRLEAASVAVSNGAVVRLYGGDHAGGSPLNLGGTGLSSSAFIVMDTSTVGAVNGMVPWTYFCVGSSPCYSRYAVYDSVLGFRPFVNDADDQVGFQDAMPSSNVRLTNDTTLASSTNINSLTILATNALVVTNAPGVGIRIESGALMFNLASTTWFRPRLYPDLDFAGRHGYVYFMASTAGGGDLWISGKLTNIASDGISFSGLSAAGVITLGETVEIRNWTGPVYVNTCRLRISGGVGPTNVPLHVMAGAEMLYHISSPFRVYIRSLSGAGKVYGRGTGDAGITAVAYYIGDNSDTAFDGTLYSSEDVPAGRATLRKVGSGTWTFNGVNACTGSTTVAEGALVINGSFATNATVSVNDASVLAGNGRIGNLLLQAGATVAPGAARSNAVGQLNVSGNATWTTNAIYQWEINNALGQAGSSSGWDLVSAGGTLNITATAGQPCTVKIVGLTAAGLSGAPTNFLQQRTYSWKIASADSISGFSADKFQLDRAGFVAIGRFTITASGSQGTGLYLTYAPPPGTVFAIH
jgi:autotransporter-associated beta strand protein